jgi:hypothetical protein
MLCPGTVGHRKISPLIDETLTRVENVVSALEGVSEFTKSLDREYSPPCEGPCEGGVVAPLIKAKPPKRRRRGGRSQAGFRSALLQHGL